MPWVRFTQDFDWKPIPQKTVAFRADMVRNVTTPCAGAAIAKGKAIRLRKPHKDVEPHEDQGIVPE